MLARKYRLFKEEDYKQAYKKGKFFSTPYFNIKYSPNCLGHARLGIVVSKRTLPKAVDRNKQKRRVRAIWGKNWQETVKKYDIIILIKHGCVSATEEQLQTAIKRFLHEKVL
ncbi:MAG: ribonuclease P protein component [Patescibacteria group bacterium]|jgi:ribonuclease P protein component